MRRAWDGVWWLLSAAFVARVLASDAGMAEAGRFARMVQGGHGAAELLEAHRQQAYFCKAIYPLIRDHPPPYALVARTVHGLEMYVYDKKVSPDIVSETIAGVGRWYGDTDRFIRMLDEYAAANGLAKHEVTFVDIGANIGWFALTLAHLGYDVIAFEPMQQNEILMRSTICRNNLGSRITYVSKGLGITKDTCSIVSITTNQGNGNAFCGNFTVPEGYAVRSTIEVDRLDNIIPPHVAAQLHTPVVKIDTEGFEANVLRGGFRFFSQPCQPKYFVLEFLGEQFRDTRQDFAGMLDRLGITYSREGFGGTPYKYVSEPVGVFDAFGWRDGLKC